MMSPTQLIDHCRKVRRLNPNQVRDHKIMLGGLLAELDCERVSQVPEKEVFGLYQRLLRDEKLLNLKQPE